MAKATATQIKYLKERLNDMLRDKMKAWDKQNPEPSKYKTSDIFKMLKKGEIQLRKTPTVADSTYCYSGYDSDLSTYFTIPGTGRKEWEEKRFQVQEAYAASITSIMDSFVLSGADFECALRAFDAMIIE